MSQVRVILSRHCLFLYAALCVTQKLWVVTELIGAMRSGNTESERVLVYDAEREEEAAFIFVEIMRNDDNKNDVTTTGILSQPL